MRTFAELIEFHLENGTRPAARAEGDSKKWSVTQFASEVGTTDRTIRNWRTGHSLPHGLEEIENALFGPNQSHQEAARLELRAAWSKARGIVSEEGGEERFAISNIPITVPRHFLGRDDLLADIKTRLSSDHGRVAITALHGLRGVGKTTLAAAYAEHHRANYRATWWIRAETDSMMRADLVALGVRLGWIAEDEKEEPALAAVAERLRNEGDGILLIFDNANNAEELRRYLPLGGSAQILVTSNAPNWGGVAAPVQIGVWPKGTGADFFLSRISGRTNERVAAEELSAALGGLPLAHEQAAAFCERLGISFAAYLERFETGPAILLDAAKDAPPEYRDRMTVAKTFALAIDEAAKLHPAAEPLIVHAALLALEPIPLFLFSEGREEFEEPLASALADDGLDEAVAALRAFALVDRESIADERDPKITTDCIRLHRLVRQVAAARVDDSAQEQARRRLLSALAMVYPYDVFREPKVWPRARRLDAAALAIVDGAAPLPTGSEEASAYLLDRLALYRHVVLAAYTEALPLFSRALAIREEVFGHEHPQTMVSLNNLAVLLQDQGNLAAARPLYERALDIREKVLGPEHPDTAISLDNLALLLQEQGDLAAARSLFERALSISEKVLGPDHPDTAIELGNLAVLLGDLGEVDEAEQLLRRAIGIYERTLGADHPITGRYRTHYARMLLKSNRIAEALQFGRAALATQERVAGPDHPWTKDSARFTADALDALGRVEDAKALREKYRIG